jgi:hypothetical protein
MPRVAKNVEKTTAPVKLTAKEAREKVVELNGTIDKLKEKIEQFKGYGWCFMCDSHKDKSKFYISTDPLNRSGIAPICKECARKLALRVDKNGHEHEPTKESVQLALKYLNKPFLNVVWDASVQESERLVAGKVKHNVWTSYIKNIAMVNYVGMTYFDSDFYKEKVIYDDEMTVENTISDKDVIESYEQNKKDTIRLLGYDPFEKEQLSDQPFLYSNLIGYLDSSEDANDDRMRTSSIIEIVKGFNHAEKINNVIASMLKDVKDIEKNVATIRSLEDTKNKIMNSVLGLAKDNGISLKHSVNASKGENTWTGKVRKMKDLNLLEAETNLYDVEYSAGLSQVAEISNAAIIKQIKLDENDYNDMLIQQRLLIDKYKKIADENEEKARVLLRENYDLKDLIKTLDKDGGS